MQDRIHKNGTLIEPTVTIITVCYNCENSIEETIESIINQTYKNFEYIIIDGNSTDNTKKIIAKYENSIDYFFSEYDNGIYDAMNKGIKLAHGKWINFMNSGDTFYDNSVLSDVFNENINKETQVIFGKSMNIYPNFIQHGTLLEFKDMWKAMPICHQATFMRLDILHKYKFNMKYKFAADYELIFRLVNDKISFLFVDRIINFTDCKNSTSMKNILKSISERKEIALHNISNLRVRVYYFLLIFRIKAFSLIKKLVPETIVNHLIKIRYSTSIYYQEKLQ